MHAVADSVTLVRRDLLHLWRDPSQTFSVVVLRPSLLAGAVGGGAVKASLCPRGRARRGVPDGVPARRHAVIETLRGLLLGTPIGAAGAVAAGWCVGVSLGSFRWARRPDARRPVG